jgi:hypothetical protein
MQSFDVQRYTPPLKEVIEADNGKDMLVRLRIILLLSYHKYTQNFRKLQINGVVFRGVKGLGDSERHHGATILGVLGVTGGGRSALTRER